MKKIVFSIMAAIILTGCGLYKTVDLSALTIGMTKAEVASVIGPPERVLTVNQTQNGFLEVLQYRTYQNEIYALEFWDDYLTGYEFLYDDVVYMPAPAPPVIRPVYGRPVFPGHYRPVKPVKPNVPNTPPSNNRPGGNNNNNRPGNSDNRPDNTNRPGSSNQQNNRPTNTRPTTRSSENDRNTETRQSTRSSSSSESSGSSGSSRTTNTRSGNTR